MTFGGCFSSSAGTIWAFSMGGFIQQEMDNECFCSDRDSAMLVHWVMLNSTASINAVFSFCIEEKKTAFQVIRHHPALISLKLQPLIHFAIRAEWPRGIIWRRVFKVEGLLRQMLLPVLKRSLQKRPDLQNNAAKYQAWCDALDRADRKTEQAKTKAWQVPEVFAVCHAVFKRGFVWSKIFHCREKKQTELKHLNAKWGKDFSGVGVRYNLRSKRTLEINKVADKTVQGAKARHWILAVKMKGWSDRVSMD